MQKKNLLVHVNVVEISNFERFQFRLSSHAQFLFSILVFIPVFLNYFLLLGCLQSWLLEH
jgi:hypothetical protein